jgi:ADP-heptose:LPS heptosyltransferase
MIGPSASITESIRQSKHPLIIWSNGGIGDAICSLPMLRALGEIYSGKAALVCGSHHGPILSELCGYGERLYLEMRGNRTGFEFDVGEVASRIHDVDTIIAPIPWHSQSVDALIAAYPNCRSIGFLNRFDVRLPFNRGLHAMDSGFCLVSWIAPGQQLHRYSSSFTFSEDELRFAKETAESLAGKRLLFVHTETKKNKQWPRAKFESVIAAFLMMNPEWAIVIANPGGVAWFGGGATSRIAVLDTTLRGVIATLARCSGFLGIDSCLLHAADLLRVPGIGLFVDSDSTRWGFRFSAFWHIQSSVRGRVIESPDVLHCLGELVRYVDTAQQAPHSK